MAHRHVYSSVYFMFNYQQKFYLKSQTILPMSNSCRLWLDFSSRHYWIWERKKRVVQIESPIQKFREKYLYY